MAWVSKNKKENIIGKKYGRLTVIEDLGVRQIPSGTKRHQFLCLCDCGNYAKVDRNKLVCNATKSCGCLVKEERQNRKALKKPIYKNGKKVTRSYIDDGKLDKRFWHIREYCRDYPMGKRYKNMMYRCFKDKHSDYKNYGGRGITVCDEWANDFFKFKEWAEQNGFREDLTLDRIDVNGNYEPSNCRWATHKEQCRNKRNTIYLTYKGQKIPQVQFAEDFNFEYQKVASLVSKGLSGEEILAKLGIKKGGGDVNADA